MRPPAPELSVELSFAVRSGPHVADIPQRDIDALRDELELAVRLWLAERGMAPLPTWVEDLRQTAAAPAAVPPPEPEPAGPIAGTGRALRRLFSRRSAGAT